MKKPIFLYGFLNGLIWIVYFTLYLSRGGFLNYFGFSILLFFICLFLGATHFIFSSSDAIFSKILGILWSFLAIGVFLSIGGLVEYYLHSPEKNRGIFFLPFYFSIVFLFIGWILFTFVGISFIKGKPFWLITVEKRVSAKITGIFLIITVILSGIFQLPVLIGEIKSIQKMKEMTSENEGEDIKHVMLFFERFDKKMKNERNNLNQKSSM